MKHEYEEKFEVPADVNHRILKVWEEHARAQIVRFYTDASFQEFISTQVLRKAENPPGPFTRFLYWFGFSCATGWDVMIGFNERSQQIFLCDKYYKWMHKLRDELEEAGDLETVDEL